MSRRFVLLDRDGTIIVERHYLSKPEQVELLPGAVEGLKQMTELGYGLAVVTNQSGVGRGYFDLAALHAIHERLHELLAVEGVKLDGLYYCPHLPEDICDCRKPAVGMLLRAAAELSFRPEESVVVGDKACDVDLGRAVGATTVLVRTGYGARQEAEGTAADYVVDDLRGAAGILSRLKE